MNKQLYVGGLDWNTTNEGLRGAFSAIGPVEEAKVVTDRDSGRSRGFGFVSFSNPNDAQQALERLDGSSLDGRSIRVNWSESKSQKSRY